MENIVAFIFRALCGAGEILLNLLSGSLGKVIRYTGKIFYKIIWPPNWFGEMNDDGVIF